MFFVFFAKVSLDLGNIDISVLHFDLTQLAIFVLHHDVAILTT